MLSKRILSMAKLAALTTVSSFPVVAQQEQADEDYIEEVSVTGYRTSLKKALDIKRNTTGFADAIVATDIAAFPDQNLAEALQRIPGVAIDRDRGIGTRVNIRSLGNIYTHTTINNIATASGSGGREVDFSIFASDLIQSVTVLKSPTAAVEEGGVAGVVAIKTAQPFDYDGLTAAASVEGTYNDSSESTDPRYALLLSNTFADDKWGVLFSFAGSERSVRVDEMFVDEFFSLGDRLYDRQGTDATTPANLDPNYTYPEKIQDSANFVHQDVWGATGSIQYRPTENLQFSIDAMIGEMEEQRDEHLYDTYTGPATSASNLTIDDSGMIIAGTFENVMNEFKSYRDKETKKFKQIGLTVDWDAGAWDVKALVGYNKATRDRALDYFKWKTEEHNLIYNLEGDYFSRTSDTFDPLQPNDMGFSNYDLDVWDVVNDKAVAELNIARDMNFDAFPALKSIQFGSRYSAKSVTSEYSWTRVQGATLTEAEDGTVTSSDEYVGQPITTVSTALLSDVLPGGGYRGVGISDWVAGSIEDGLASYYPTGDFPLQFRPQSYYKVDEDVLSLYAMADFDFDIGNMPALLNMGMRYVNTKQRSFGYQQIDGVWSDGPVEFEADYTDWLPSVNFSLNLREDLMLRFAAAKVMSRAQLSDLTGRMSVSYVNNEISAGNPELEPLRADQLDLGLEWYFDEESLFAVTAFYKDLKSVISEAETGTTIFEGQEFDLTTKVNVEGIELKGLEAIFQMPFKFLPGALDGFGVNMNYTLVDASLGTIAGTERELPLFGLSKHSYNVTAYYEKYGFDIRLAYNYKGESIRREVGGYYMYTDGYGQLDMSAGYRISENFQVTLKVINLTDAETYDTWEANGTRYPARNQVYGRRISLGLRASF